MSSSTFFVPGNPAPQGSKNVFNGNVVESSKRVKPWRRDIAAAARRALSPRTGPISLKLLFVMKRPAALPKSKPTPPCIKRVGDIDKVTRAVLDALTGVAYQDDSQVTELAVRQRTAEIDEPPGVKITVDVDGAAFTPPIHWAKTEAALEHIVELKHYLDEQGIAA